MALTLTPGFDISNWQAELTEGQVRELARTYGFGGEKIGEGISYVDPHQAANRRAFARVGFPRLAYWVGTTSDPANQARAFLNVMGEVRPRERVALDVELSTGMTAGAARVFLEYLIAHARKRHWLRRWLRRRVRPVIYASDSHMAEMLRAEPAIARLADLWVARYPNVPYLVPGWAVWQSSDVDPATHGDHDFYRGGRIACRRFFLR